MRQKECGGYSTSDGMSSFFLTVTPDDDNHYSIQILANEEIDDQDTIDFLTDQELLTKGKLRSNLRLKYPGICALFLKWL